MLGDGNLSSNQNLNLAKLPNRFVRIKVNRQSYEGKASIVILVRDVSEKINHRMQQIKIQEQKIEAQQAESFTATVSHEMKTPLGSILFFVKQLHTLLVIEQGAENWYIRQKEVPPEQRETVKRYFKCILMQLMYVQSFVDDLLDLRQIREGAFAHAEDVFNPTEILDSICEIFSPQTSAKNVKLFWTIERGLSLPNDGSEWDRALENMNQNVASDKEQHQQIPQLFGDVRRF